MGAYPDLITCDFFPNLISAISQVYGSEVIQIDLFHVMQELNRGIKADLLLYRERQFDAERKELQSLRNWINSIQKTMVEGNTFSISLQLIGAPPKIDPSHELSMNCLAFTLKVVEILKLNVAGEFFLELRTLLGALEPLTEPLGSFSNGIVKKIPKKRFTEKGMFRIKKEVLKKLKTYYLKFRKPIDEESMQFYHDFHVIFFQPENLTQKRKELLESFLTAHPNLNI